MKSNGYCSLQLDSTQAKEINKVLKQAGIESLPAKDFHCTLMYDESNPTIKMLKNTKTYKATVKSVGILGDALVLHLESPSIQQRHKELKNAGFKHSYSTLKVHMSLNYNPKQGDLDLVKLLVQLKGIPSVLKFGNEKFSTLED